MNGQTTKYYYHKDSKQSRLSIPVSIARSLNWKKGDEIHIKFEVINEKKAKGVSVTLVFEFAEEIEFFDEVPDDIGNH